MQADTIFLILVAATLHATWNAMVKGAGEKYVSIGLIACGNAAVGFPLIFIFEIPNAEAWVFIALTVSIHLLYFVFLIRAYQRGEFSLVYPVARGVAPVLVALTGWVLAGERLEGWQWIGIIVISGAIGLLATARGAVNLRIDGLGNALLTGLTIAAYTVVDGLGGRASGDALGYVGWSFFLQLPVGLLFLAMRRDSIGRLEPAALFNGFAGGIISGLSYGIVIYCMSFSELGLVSAIRESSVVIGAMIGVLWFGERPWFPRVLAACLVATGIIILGAG